MQRMCLRRPLRAALVAALLCAGLISRSQIATSSIQAALGVTVFDTVNGATCTYTSATPRTYLGLPFEAADSGAPLAINGLEAHFASTVQADYEDVRIRVQFWDRINQGLNPVFVQAAGEVREISIGARQFITRNVYSATIAFTTPVTFETAPFHALTLNVQGRVNGAYVDSDTLTPCLRLIAPFAIGTVALTPSDYGYYRNVYGQTHFNFQQEEQRTMGLNTALMLRLFAKGPAPALTARAFLPEATR